MFLGHFAAGMAAKRIEPRVNLGIYFAACQLLDLICPVLVLLGIEKVRVDWEATKMFPVDLMYMPWSHGGVMTLVWSVLFGGGFLVYRKWPRAAVVIGAVVLSHWFLDALVHRPDLPVFFEGPMVGLTLWNHPPIAVALELLLFCTGVHLYRRAKAATGERARTGFHTLIVFLLVIHFAIFFGPKPPLDASPAMIVGPGLAMWLLVLWAWRVDQRE